MSTSLPDIYKTWLPNAAGYLSFKHLGEGGQSRSSKEDTVNGVNASTGNAFCSHVELRNLHEWPKYSAPLQRSRSSKHIFLMQGDIIESCANGEKCIKGIVLSVPRAYQNEVLVLHEQAKKIKQITPSDVAAFLSSWRNLQTDADKQNAMIAMRFCLEGDGCLELESIQNAGHASANSAPGTIEHDGAFEIYSFLRDAFHKHKFHAERDDCNLLPYPVKDANDNTWIISVAKELHRTAVSSHRKSEDQSNALGKLAYLKAFQSVVESKKLEAYLPIIHTSPLKESIEASRANCEQQLQRKKDAHSFFVAIAAIFVTMFLALLAYSQIPCIENLSFETKCEKTKFQAPQSYFEILRLLLAYVDFLLLGVAVGIFVFAAKIYRLTKLFSQYIKKLRFIELLILVHPIWMLLQVVLLIGFIICWCVIWIANLLDRQAWNGFFQPLTLVLGWSLLISLTIMTLYLMCQVIKPRPKNDQAKP